MTGGLGYECQVLEASRYLLFNIRVRNALPGLSVLADHSLHRSCDPDAWRRYSLILLPLIPVYDSSSYSGVEYITHCELNSG